MDDYHPHRHQQSDPGLVRRGAPYAREPTDLKEQKLLTSMVVLSFITHLPPVFRRDSG